MLAEVDLALRALFRAKMKTLGAGTPSGVAEGQVGIQPPDDDWMTDVNSFAPKRGLNVYLADVRENRKLRSNERTDRNIGGIVYHDPAPMRIDCHYLISAWSAATDRKLKTIDEHRVLVEALEVLVAARGLSVAGVDLPIAITPPEGFTKLAEFWGTMGTKQRWRPAIQLVVTVPVRESAEMLGYEVTTRVTEYRQNGNSESTDGLIQVAGVVEDHSFSPAIRVAGAWVQLEDTNGIPLQATRTNNNGEFTFLGLEPGEYSLRLRAEGRSEPPTTAIVVPEPSGTYDLHFS